MEAGKLTLLNINIKNNIINRGYLYYYTCDSETPYRLISDIMIVAKQNKIDEFVMMNIMENFVYNELNFLERADNIYYYLDNYKCYDMIGKQIGLII